MVHHPKKIQDCSALYRILHYNFFFYIYKEHMDLTCFKSTIFDDFLAKIRAAHHIIINMNEFGHHHLEFWI